MPAFYNFLPFKHVLSLRISFLESFERDASITEL